MKFTRALAWFLLAVLCVAAAIAQAPWVTGVEAVGIKVAGSANLKHTTAKEGK